MLSGKRNDMVEKLDLARRDLLDLGLRNPLISYRPLKSRGLEIVDELAPQVFDLLVNTGKPAYFLPLPDEPAQQSLVPSGEVEALSQPEGTGTSDDRHTDNKLQTKLTSAQLQTRLLSTYYAARTSIEEQGVNILYLALGMLEWYESDDSDTPRRAPLLLIPVTLERSSVRERFLLSYDGEDLEENLSLREKLKEFGLVLPEFPAEDEIDVLGYFGKVGRAVRSQRRWRVDDAAIALGFFSFTMLLMYRDLDPENWPEDSPLEEHPVLAALLQEEGFSDDDIPLTEDDYLDSSVDLSQFHTVVEADSSQMLTLLRVAAGLNLVVQGPPGTGKSQTITNVIAEAVTSGKTVLFVSEKMAALEVVKRRLDQVGVGDACLELHSHKAKKKVVLDELQRTLTLGRPVVRGAESDSGELRAAREQLDAYCEALNTPIGESGVTPHIALGHLALARATQVADGLAEIPIDDMASWPHGEYRLKLSLVEELQEKLKVTGVPSRHPFWGSQVEVCLPQDEMRIERALRQTVDAITGLRAADDALARLLLLPPSASRAETQRLLKTAERVLEAPALDGVKLESPQWVKGKNVLLKGLSAGVRLRHLHTKYGRHLESSAWEFDTTEVRDVLTAMGAKWWRSMSGNYRGARKQAHGLFAVTPPKDLQTVLQVLDAIAEAQGESKKLGVVASVLPKIYGEQWNEEQPDWEHLSRCATYLADAHADVRAGEVHEGIWLALREGIELKKLREAVARTREAIEVWDEMATELAGILELDEQVALGTSLPALDFETANRHLGEWSASRSRLHETVGLNQLLTLCQQQGLGALRVLVSGWEQAGERLVESFKQAWFLALYQRALCERQSLARFDEARQDRHVTKFRELDRILIENTRSKIALAHWSRLPQSNSVGQLGILRREFEKKRRHLPIRQLLVRAGEAIQRIKPVFMMSPLSVAAYLTPGVLSFDLVVFDEASQVRPVDALGALARASQAVVVGDDRQLPPTSFFEAVAQADGVDDGNVTADIESILGLFRSQGARQSMLRWHYRSRHESLIAVSNHEFYGNKLVIFPSPDGQTPELGLVHHLISDAVYDRGRSRRNELEATRVAEAVMNHARAQLAKPLSKQHTLGVAAFSVAQMEAILDHLEHLRRSDDSCEDFFHNHCHEPFFVKNLENVQGDERDVIFISVGYGRNADGHIAMDFGPVNRDGGERRLNVLITRARRRCEVFTNLSAEDIDLGRSRQRGVQALKTFLEYAQTGRLGIAVETDRDDESPFEDAVWTALNGLGYDVARQVGTGGFFIDLAVKDPERSGRYLLGIECDGATYHSARSARDRDRLRQQVLEGLGWTIHRIWSTSWYRNEAKELQRLVKAIESAKVAGKTASTGDSGSPEKADSIERDRPQVKAAPVSPEVHANVAEHGYGHGSEAGSAFEAGYRDAIKGRPGGAEYFSVRLARAYDRGYDYGVEALKNSGTTADAPPDSQVARPANSELKIPTYVVCKIGALRLTGGKLHEVPPSQLAPLVQRVIDVEAPVHIDEVCWRIADAAQVGRIGHRIRENLEKACSRAVSNGSARRRGDFFWRADAAPVVPRDRSELPLRSRKLELVAPEEISAAISLMTAEACGIDTGDLPQEVCRLLGFGRCSADMKDRVESVLENELQSGRLKEQRGQIFVGEKMPQTGGQGSRSNARAAEAASGTPASSAQRTPSDRGSAPRPGDPQYYNHLLDRFGAVGGEDSPG